MKSRKSESSKRGKARPRYIPRTKEGESKMRPRRNRNRRDGQVYSRRLKVLTTSKIVQKLYDGQQPTEKEAAPELPRPTARGNVGKKEAKKGGERASFAWQSTGKEDTKEDYNWEYFMENGEENHEFDTLFTEEGDEMAYDHYYETTAYQPGRKTDRSCNSCTQDARMCRMEKCTIS